MPAAYSSDLRERVVHTVVEGTSSRGAADAASWALDGRAAPDREGAARSSENHDFRCGTEKRPHHRVLVEKRVHGSVGNCLCLLVEVRDLGRRPTAIQERSSSFG